MSGRDRNKRIKLNNHGFSLLELLIVIAIITIVTVVTIFGINALSKGNAKKMNKNLYSAISELKTSTMSKSGNWKITIGKVGKEFVVTTYQNDIVRETFKCSASRVSMTYTNDGGAGTTYNLADDTMTIVFSREDGSCKSVKYGSTELNNPGASSPALSGVFTVKSSGTEYKSELWYATGRVTTRN